MMGNKIEMYNLSIIYNENIDRKCVDDSEAIRKEIMKQLFDNHKIVGIIAYSSLYTSSIALYRVNGCIAEQISYLHLRLRENNRVWYSISEQNDSIGNEPDEFEYTDIKTASNIIVRNLLEKFNF